MDDMTDSDIGEFVETFNESFADHWNFSRQPASKFVKIKAEAPAR